MSKKISSESLLKNTWIKDLSVFIIFLCALIFWSPVIPALTNIMTSWLYLPALSVLSITLIINRVSIKILILMLMLLLMLLSVALFIDDYYFIRFISIPIAIFASFYAIKSRYILDKLCSFMTIFAIVACVCSIVGFIYALSGADYSFSIINPDGRENYFYLTTFTNYVRGTIIRPSFIYDEPGALSFVLCSICFLRLVLRRPIKTTFIILMLGVITLSLAHLIILILTFIFYSNLKSKILLLVISLIIISVTITDSRFSFFYSRFEITEDGLKGDNRSEQVENFLEVVDIDLILFGNYRCMKDKSICESHGDISSSIVSPAYNGGLMLLIVQLFIHLILVLAMILRPNKVTISVSLMLFLLLLQRPYFHMMGYQIFIFMITFLLINQSLIRNRYRLNNNE
ncbi:hypothetical protein BCT82_06845 [Vibrio breoganii]|nr:hypothetical protein BCT82_06845 [Vibrio breoganii]